MLRTLTALHGVQCSGHGPHGGAGPLWEWLRRSSHGVFAGLLGGGSARPLVHRRGDSRPGAVVASGPAKIRGVERPCALVGWVSVQRGYLAGAALQTPHPVLDTARTARPSEAVGRAHRVGGRAVSVEGGPVRQLERRSQERRAALVGR